MWFLPTRGRPAGLARFIEAWHKTGASTPLIVLLDADDAELPHYKKLSLPDNWQIYVAPERRTLVQLYNEAFRRYPNEPWYGGMSDDVIPRTMHWDTELVKTAGTDKIAYPNDLIEGEDLATMPVIGGDLVREMGWYLMPGLIRLYGDTVWTAIGRRKQALRYRGDVVVEHMHFAVGKGEYDETAKKPLAHKDKQTYDQWLWSIDPMVQFVTIKWGTKYSAEYVNILFDMIRRNLPPEFGKKFICFTEDASGLDEGIEVRSLPQGVTGWWNKLYLFKKYLFEEGSRIVFFDLDTAILSSITDIALYKGDFAILRDFYNPRGMNSSIMMWRGSFGTNIWDSFVKAGMPNIDGGDQAWIEKGQPPADMLQDLFLNAFASFKEKGQLAPPAGAKIICFHGEPKPHQIKDGWVPRVWKKGGAADDIANTPGANDPISNVRNALSLPLPNLQAASDPDTSHICIVGGGSSAHDCIEELKQRQKQGQKIWALGKNYAWLVENGIQPDAHVMFAAQKENAAFVPQKTEALLLYASQCHPNVLAKAATASKNILIWHPMIDGIRVAIGTRQVIFIGGGSTTGMLAITLAYTLGCRNIHLFGYDSSYRTPQENSIQVNVGDRNFTSVIELAQQINEFRMLLKSLIPQGVGITLHGDGLLPYVMQQITSAALAAKASA